MQLLECRPAHLPVVLLVQAVENHRVGQDLVEQLAAEHASLVAQRDWQQPQRAELLDERALLDEQRLAALSISTRALTCHHTIISFMSLVSLFGRIPLLWPSRRPVVQS